MLVAAHMCGAMSSVTAQCLPVIFITHLLKLLSMAADITMPLNVNFLLSNTYTQAQVSSQMV